MGIMVWAVLGGGWIAVSDAFAFSLGYVLRSAPKPSRRRKRGGAFGDLFWREHPARNKSALPPRAVCAWGAGRGVRAVRESFAGSFSEKSLLILAGLQINCNGNDNSGALISL